MKLNRRVLGLSLAMVVGAAGISWSQPEQLELPPQDAVKVEDERPLADPAFDKLVNLTGLASSLHRGDARELADVALLLAEAERVLQRPHRAVTSKALLNQALASAVRGRDRETLARLEKAAQRAQDKDFLERVRTALTLAAAPRATVPLPQFTKEEIEEGAREEYLGTLKHIEQAVRLRDREGLAALLDGLGNGGVLADKHLTVLAKAIREAQANLPEKGTEEDDVLAQLASGSRSSDRGPPDLSAAGKAAKEMFDAARIPPSALSYSFYRIGPNQAKLWYVPFSRTNVSGLPKLNQIIFNYAQGKMGRKVGDGQCGTFVQQAVAAAVGTGGTRWADYPNRGDYVWGKRVAIITPRDQSGVAKLLPGDLLQYRNCRFEGKFTYNGSSRTWKSNASHHSAIVSYVSPSGTYANLFEQNNSDRQWVVHGLTSFYHLKEGVIWAYRASR